MRADIVQKSNWWRLEFQETQHSGERDVENRARETRIRDDECHMFACASVTHDANWFEAWTFIYLPLPRCSISSWHCVLCTLLISLVPVVLSLADIFINVTCQHRYTYTSVRCASVCRCVGANASLDRTLMRMCTRKSWSNRLIQARLTNELNPSIIIVMILVGRRNRGAKQEVHTPLNCHSTDAYQCSLCCVCGLVCVCVCRFVRLSPKPASNNQFIYR